MKLDRTRLAALLCACLTAACAVADVPVGANADTNNRSTNGPPVNNATPTNNADTPTNNATTNPTNNTNSQTTSATNNPAAPWTLCTIEVDDDGDGQVDVLSQLTYDASLVETQRDVAITGDNASSYILHIIRDGDLLTGWDFDMGRDGSINSRFIWTYDANDLLQTATQEVEGVVEAVSRFTHNGDDTVQEVDTGDDGVVERVLRTTYHLRSTNQRARFEELDAAMSPTRLDTWEYDAQNRVTVWERDNAPATVDLTARSTYTYQGEVQTESVDTTGDGAANRTTTWTRDGDELVRKETRTAAGELRFLSFVEWEGEALRTEFFDNDGDGAIDKRTVDRYRQDGCRP